MSVRQIVFTSWFIKKTSLCNDLKIPILTQLTKTLPSFILFNVNSPLKPVNKSSSFRQNSQISLEKIKMDLV